MVIIYVYNIAYICYKKILLLPFRGVDIQLYVSENLTNTRNKNIIFNLLNIYQ